MERRKPFMQNVSLGGPYTIFDIKVMLCYLLKTVNKPISAETLWTIMASEELVNYFEYENAMGELLKAGHVEAFTDESGEDFYKISPKCIPIVSDLESNLAISLRSRVVTAAMKIMYYKQNEEQNNVKVIPCEEGGYILSIDVPGTPRSLCKMELYFPEKLQAERARERFIDNPTLVYSVTLASLTGDTSHLMSVLRDI